MSAIKKAIIGAITTAVTAGGAWFVTHLGGGESEPAVTPANTPAPAPVVVNVQQTQENKQQVKQGGGTTTIIKERTVEKPAATSTPASKPAQDEEDPW